jgi:hypothetical protein
MRWASRRLLSASMMAPAIVSCLLAAASPARKIVAGAKCAPGEPQTDSASTLVQGVLFTARPIGVEAYESRLEKRAPGMGGLFRGPDGRPAPFQVFLVSVENRNKDLGRLQPGNVVRLGGDNTEDHILDYTDLYRYLQGIGKAGESLESVSEEIFDSGVTLDPDRPVERLLFFRDLTQDKRRKGISLLFSSFQVGSETYQAGISWHFEKVK